MVPMLTLAARLYNGSVHAGVRSMASTFKAAALRKMAPRFVGLTTSSKTAIHVISLQISDTEGRTLLRMSASIPRVSL